MPTFGKVPDVTVVGKHHNVRGVRVMTATQLLRDVWEKHDGRLVTVGGLRCNLRVRTHEAIYPYAHTVLNVSAVPTVAARRSVAYRTVRAELRDDWSTDVLESDISVQSDILVQVG